jgi:isopenicillin N synthase-like dioxygenase
MTEPTLEIPVVDLKDLQSPHLEDQHRASEALNKAFGFFGLVFIRNHGIDMERLEGFYDSFLEFTSRPTEEKEKLSLGDIWYQRGWTPPNTERAVVAGGQPDFKECYFAAPEPLDPICKLQYPEIYSENFWPDNAEAFKTSYLNMGHQLHEIGLLLLRGCAKALGLEPYRFESAVYGGPHVSRALRYLPLKEEQLGTGILWGEEHTDFNLLTLLPGGRFLDEEGKYCARPNDGGGLYLRTRPTEEHPRGIQIKGTAPDGCIVAQVGQQFEIITGGRYLATPHVIHAPESVGYTRVALAHFVHLHSHQLLFPLDKFQTPETIEAYSPPVLAGNYGTKTLVDIGLAPSKTLDQLGYRQYDRLGDMRAVEDAES